MGLNHSVTVQMVFENLLLYHILTELEKIDTMNEVLFRQVIAFAFANAFNSFCTKFQVFHDFFEAEELVFAKNDQSENSYILERGCFNTATESAMLVASSYLLKHHLAARTSRQA